MNQALLLAGAAMLAMFARGSDASLTPKQRFERDVISRARALGATVTSWCRDPEHNARVGGSEHSEHLTCEAADLTHPKGSEWLLRQLLPMLRTWDQAILYAGARGGHLHIGVQYDGEPNRMQLRVAPAGMSTIPLVKAGPAARGAIGEAVARLAA